MTSDIRTAAEAKRRRRQRERRRIAAGALPIWSVGTQGEDDWHLIAARSASAALRHYEGTQGLCVAEDHNAEATRAVWSDAVEDEPLITQDGAEVWGDAVYGYGQWFDNGRQCDDCFEHYPPSVVRDVEGNAGFGCWICDHCAARETP